MTLWRLSSNYSVKYIRLLSHHFANAIVLALIAFSLRSCRAMRKTTSPDRWKSYIVRVNMGRKNAGGRNNVTSTGHTFSTSGARDFEHRLAGEESIKRSPHRDNVTITRLPLPIEHNGLTVHTACGLSTSGFRPSVILPRPPCRRPGEDADNAVSDRPHHRVSRLQSAVDVA